MGTFETEPPGDRRWRTALWAGPSGLLLAALVMEVGYRIPLPGVDIFQISEREWSSPGLWEQASILAIGIQPFFTILIGLEIARLLFPGFGALLVRSKSWRTGVLAGAGILAIAMSFFQGFALANALTIAGLKQDYSVALWIMAATLAGGTAATMALAGTIRVRGLALAGLWAVVALPAVPGWWQSSVLLIEGIRYGSIEPWTAAAFLLVPAAAIVPIVFTASALQRRVSAAGCPVAPWSVVLVWPPFVANSVVNWIALAAVDFAILSGWAGFNAQVSLFLWISLALVPVAVALTVALYARLVLRLDPEAGRWRGRAATLAMIALAQAGILAGFHLVDLLSPIPFFVSAPHFVALVTLLFFTAQAAGWIGGGAREDRRRERHAARYAAAVRSPIGQGHDR